MYEYHILTKEVGLIVTMTALDSALILLAVASYALGGPLPPYNLKCQGNLVGLSEEKLQHLNKYKLFSTDKPNPTFSWTVAHTERAARQSAFQVIVATDQNLKNIIWDSGKVLSQYQTSLRYAGPDLHTGKTYFWRVMWWDHKGEVAVSEETGHFLVGVLDPKQWEEAKWIAAGDDIKTAPYLHKTFQIGSTGTQNATLMVAGLGFNKVFVNDVDLSAQYDPPEVLTPGWTNYEKLIPYSTYNIPLSNFSSLTIGVMLGRGWRNTGDYALKDPGGIPASDSTERVLKVIMYYFDYSINSSAYLVTDETWSADETNITSDSIYNGYTYGAVLGRKLVVGASVKVVTGPSGQLYYPEMPYMAEVGIEKPVKIYSMNDYQVVDFGNNSAGYCQVYCDKESSFSIHHAEVPMHKPYGDMDGSLYYGNLRGAKATDTYSGEAKTTFKPLFTYHGFRYAEVKGITVTDSNIQKIVVHSNLKANSKFESSISLLNNIQENCVRGQLSNLMSVITDCNQRDERLGWMGDATLSAQTMTLNFDMQAFHANFLQLIETEMINGTIPDVVPFYRYGSRPADPSWSAAFPEILYQIATIDKDMDVTGKYYPAVLEYIKTTLSTIPDQGISKLPNCHYGDWVPPPPNPKVDNTFTGAFSFLMSIKQTKEMADMLGKKDDATMLQQAFEKHVAEFNKGFMTSDTQYLNGIQATYVLPLAIGAVPADKMDAFIKAFLNRLEDPNQDNSHITGGITTTRHLFPVLTQTKQHDIALKIAQQIDYPSYGFMIHNKFEPATAIWELWNSHNGSAGMDSRNHHMYSSISGWMVTDMAGISVHKGSKEIHFYPARALGLSHVSVSLEHPKPVHLSWRRNGGIQCAKQAENQSPLNPNLPKHNDLTISCGDEDGGTIEKVLFASYGNPTGHCGGYHKLGSCHVPNTVDVVEKVCLGKRSCIVPTGADFWDNPCTEEIKWLSVSVQCKSEMDNFIYSSIRVNVSVPMGSRGLLHLPAHGKHNLKLWDGNKIIFSERNSLNPTLGITSAKWESDSDSLVLELDSGTYDFVWKGDNPNSKCLDSRSLLTKDDTLLLECTNSTDVITTIHWASYGTPELTTKDACSTHMLGKCHAGSSKFALERECLGKNKCIIHVDESFFGKTHCLGSNEQGHLIVEYTCNSRTTEGVFKL